MTVTNNLSLFAPLSEEESATISGGRHVDLSGLLNALSPLGLAFLDGSGASIPTDISYDDAKQIIADAQASVTA